MWHEAEEREDDALRSNTHFQEGRLHDAAGRFELAEAAFAAALAIDSALGRGPRAIADVWHSLGIVRSNLGRREDALEAFRMQLQLVREAGSFLETSVLNTIGSELLQMGRIDEALMSFEDAVDAAREHEVPLHDLATAYFGQGEALRQSKQFVDAYLKLVVVTRQAALASELWPELADVVARAWFIIGIIASRALVNRAPLAAAAFWYAAATGTPQVAARAREELAEMPERQYLVGDPRRYRVLYKEDDKLTVAAAKGPLLDTFTTFVVGPEVSLWDIVDLELDNLQVVSIRRAGVERAPQSVHGAHHARRPRVRADRGERHAFLSRERRQPARASPRQLHPPWLRGHHGRSRARGRLLFDPPRR